MSFTYDVTTTNGLIRLMIGDTVSASANFQDEELNALLNLTQSQISGPVVPFGAATLTNDLLCYTCASALDALAARVAASPNGQTIQIGDYKLTGKDQVGLLKDQAQRWRDVVEQMPAWGIGEENLSGFNELTIIRNWVLRTEV